MKTTTRKPKKKREPKVTEIFFSVPQQVTITYEFGIKIPTKKLKQMIDCCSLERYLIANFDKAVERGEDEGCERQYGDYDFDALEVDQRNSELFS